MPRRLRHPVVALLSGLLLVPALAACGSSTSHSSKGGLGAVSLTGEVGTSLTAKWHGKVARPKSTKVTTLVKGKGAKVANGESANTYLWIGDGTTKKVAYSDYTKGSPESVPMNGQLSTLFTKLFKDATYGSRVAAVTTASDLFGSSSGNAQLGIGPDDSLVVVADIVEKAQVSPTPSDSKAHDAPAGKLPRVVLKNGKPAGLSWKGVAKPALATPVQRVVLKRGSGPAVKATDTITVSYLGETYQAKKPFDENYSKQPTPGPLSGFIPGWRIGLTGVKVGSRVLVQIPPAYAYGAQGGGSDIPGNATLWFVIDVVKAR